MNDKKDWEPYKVVLKGGTSEIAEKKSRFIATVRSVETQKEAAAFIEEMKKKYADADHNCSAYVLGKNAEITRCSDDGEPTATAGRPMLDVLLGAKVCNVGVVVTRYFGGTLLGTGGLVRAYSQAVKGGLEASTMAIKKYGVELAVVTDYNNIGKILYFLEQKSISIQNSEYTEMVKLLVRIPIEELENIQKAITEMTAGKTEFEEVERAFYVDKPASV